MLLRHAASDDFFARLSFIQAYKPHIIIEATLNHLSLYLRFKFN